MQQKKEKHESTPFRYDDEETECGAHDLREQPKSQIIFNANT